MKNKLKLIVTSCLLIFVIVSVGFAIFGRSSSVSRQENVKVVDKAQNRIVVYYFHGNARCQSCYKIENYSKETIFKKFSSGIESGTLQWQVINVEEGMNSHFIQDYALSTKSIVLSEVREGKEYRWKNLDRIWQLLNDKEAFSLYIENEVQQFLKGES